MRGLEYFHSEKLWIYHYETIFPLKTVLFENMEAMCVNEPEEYLSEIFGDYMSYPKKIGVGHSMYLNLSPEDEKIIKELN